MSIELITVWNGAHGGRNLDLLLVPEQDPARVRSATLAPTTRKKNPHRDDAVIEAERALVLRYFAQPGKRAVCRRVTGLSDKQVGVAMTVLIRTGELVKVRDAYGTHVKGTWQAR